MNTWVGSGLLFLLRDAIDSGVKQTWLVCLFAFFFLLHNTCEMLGSLNSGTS